MIDEPWRDEKMSSGTIQRQKIYSTYSLNFDTVEIPSSNIFCLSSRLYYERWSYYTWINSFLLVSLRFPTRPECLWTSHFRTTFSRLRIYLQLRNRLRWFTAKGGAHQGQKHRFRGQAFSSERLGRREPRSAEHTEGELGAHEFNRRHEPLSGHHPHVQL